MSTLTIEQHELLDEIIHRIEQKQCEPEPCCWLLDEHGDDTEENYCYDCIKTLIATPAYDENFSRAGYAFESDNPMRCEECGKVLDYTLTNYGVEQELDHFAEYPPDSPDANECFELARVANGVSDAQKPKLYQVLKNVKL